MPGEHFPSTPHSSHEVAAEASVASRTSINSGCETQSGATQSLEALRRQRSELRQSIASKEQTLRSLGLVKLHRTKVFSVEYFFALH